MLMKQILRDAKWGTAFLFSLLILGAALLAGCGSSPVTSSVTGSGSGSSSSGGSSGGSSGSTSAAGDTITISGTISIDNTATASKIKSQSLRPQAATAASGYTLLATDVESGAGKRATTSSAGAYSFSLVNGETYVFVVFDDSNRLVAVVTGTDTVATQSLQSLGIQATSVKYVVSAFKPVDKTSSANIVTNKTSGHAWWGTKDSDLKAQIKMELATDIVAQADTSGETVATGGDNGNFGKGVTKPSGATANAVDSRLSGIPDALIPVSQSVSNGLAPTEISPASDRILFADISYELRTQYENTDNFASVTNPGQAPYHLNFSVVPMKGKENLVSAVYVASLPSYKTKLLSGGVFTILDGGTFADNQEWSSTSPAYRLFKTSTMTNDSRAGTVSWQVLTKILGASMKVGDAFVFHVDYSDGTSEEFTRILQFAYSAPPKLVSYKTGNDPQHATDTPGEGVEGTMNNPIPVYMDQPLTLTWSLPKDESGTVMPGGTTLYFNIGDGQITGNASINGIAAGVPTVSKEFTPNTLFGSTSATGFNVNIICNNSSASGGSGATQVIYFKKKT